MATHKPSKRSNYTAADKQAEKKFYMILIGITVLLILLMYFVFSGS